MKILYFYQYFSTPKGSWGTRVYEFAKKWIDQGHEVIVVSSIYSKSDIKAKKFIENQNFEGINVKIINILIDNKQSSFKRIWTFIQYLVLASWYALKIKADVVIASSGPISVGVPGLISKFRSKKFVFEVRDLWPEGAICMGVIKNKILIRFSYFFEKLCYKNSDLIVALSPGIMKDIIDRYSIKNIVTVPNAANLDLFKSNQEQNSLPDFFKNKKIAIYNGNIGKVNNSMLLLNTARILKDKNINDLLILLVGDGQQKNNILQAIEREKLDTIKIIDLIPKNKLVSYIQNSLVSLVPLEASKLWDTSSPNKLFESLAAGTPVIQTTNGWLKELLDKEKCGYTVSPNNPEELAELLIKLKDNKNLIFEMKQNATQTAQNNFNKDCLSKKMLKALLEITNS